MMPSVMSITKPASCYRRVASLIPLVGISNCSWCAGRHLGWQRMNVCMNYCKWLLTKASPKCIKCKIYKFPQTPAMMLTWHVIQHYYQHWLNVSEKGVKCSLFHCGHHANRFILKKIYILKKKNLFLFMYLFMYVFIHLCNYLSLFHTLVENHVFTTKSKNEFYFESPNRNS